MNGTPRRGVYDRIHSTPMKFGANCTANGNILFFQWRMQKREVSLFKFVCELELVAEMR